MHAAILAALARILVSAQFVFNGGALNSGAAFTPAQLTTDCEVETRLDWQAFGWGSIEPLGEDPADTQVGDVCRTQLVFPSSISLP